MGSDVLDVLILGAGPGGCATALALARLGVGTAHGSGGVALVDRPARRRPRVGESATPDVAVMLGQLGLPRDLAALGHRPYHANLSLWGGGSAIADPFLRRGQGHGWHLDRPAFDAWLRGEAVARGARLFSPAALKDIAPHPAGGWRVVLSDGREVRARVVVDAAGRRAPLATRLGARRHRLDDQVALTVAADAAPGLTGLSLVEPCREGWWYAARLPDGRAVVSLMTDADVARQERLRDPGAFLDAWRRMEALPDLVPPVRPKAVEAVAAHGAFTDRAAGPGWLAVGDALIGFDPLTSSGLSGALSDALAAAECIAGWLAGEPAAGPGGRYATRAEATLRTYLTQHRAHYRAEGRWPDAPFWSRRRG